MDPGEGGSLQEPCDLSSDLLLGFAAHLPVFHYEAMNVQDSRIEQDMGFQEMS